jgi:hypothetical protein
MRIERRMPLYMTNWEGVTDKLEKDFEGAGVVQVN